MDQEGDQKRAEGDLRKHENAKTRTSVDGVDPSRLNSVIVRQINEYIRNGKGRANVTTDKAV